MAQQIIGVGTVANDGTGDTERAAWIKANANFTELFRSNPAGRPTTIAFVGDSIASMMWSPDHSASPLFWAQREYTADLVVPDYVDLDGTPDEGHLGGVSGSPSSSLLTAFEGFDAQIDTLEALDEKPDVVFIQTFQNDFIDTLAQAATVADNATTFITRALAAGVTLCVLMGRPPKTEDGTGTHIPEAHEELNRILRQFCATTPGTHFLEAYPLLKDRTMASELGADRFVGWSGTDGGADGYSLEGTHPGHLAGRALVPIIVPLLKQIARPLQSRVHSATIFDLTNNPYGNVLGKSGIMYGTEGKLNDTPNANVAGVDDGSYPNRCLPWGIWDGDGITATPTLVMGADGYMRQRITLSGTATDEATIEFALAFYFGLPSAIWSMEAMIDLVGVEGLSTFYLGGQLGDFGLGFSPALIPGPITESYFVRQRAARASTTTEGSTNAVHIRFVFRDGETTSGHVDIGRVGIFRDS